jgi:hypothetical protein
MTTRLASLVLVAACGSAPATAPITNQTATATNRNAIALAVVICDMEPWLGNDDFETDPNARFPGALHDLEKGLDALALPTGSTIAVFGYSTGSHVIVARRPAAGFTGAALGGQRTYRNRIGTDLVQGVVMALDDLERAQEPHEVLVIVGDGNDTNNETAATLLVNAAKRAAAAHVTVRALVWKSAISAEDDIVHKLTPNVKLVANSRELATLLPAAAAP